MSLIACKDCGQQVSSKAPGCPHCGRPFRRRFPVGVIIRLLFLLFAFYMISRFVLPIYRQTMNAFNTSSVSKIR